VQRARQWPILREGRGIEGLQIVGGMSTYKYMTPHGNMYLYIHVLINTSARLYVRLVDKEP